MALALAGVAVAVATVRGARLPRLVTFWLPAAIGVLMVARASWGAGSDLAVLAGRLDGSEYTAWWDLLLWSPFFGAWGAAWLRAAMRGGHSSVRMGALVGLLVTLRVKRRDAGAARQGRREGDRSPTFPRPRTQHGGDRRPPFRVERCEKAH